MGQWWVRESTVLCGLALLIGGGYWQGRQTGRWQPLSAARSVDFALLPAECDNWTSTGFELSPQELQIGQIDGYFARRYQHLETGDVVTVLVLTGPGGPISVHPPEVCFAGRGYRKESKSHRVSLPNSWGGEDHQFEMAVFRGPESTEGHRVQLLWGWTATGVWSAPANPRLSFARLPRAYKIYVSRTLQPGHDRQDNELCLDLMTQLVPEFQRQFSGAAPSDAAQDSARDSGRVGVADDAVATIRPDGPATPVRRGHATARQRTRSALGAGGESGSRPVARRDRAPGRSGSTEIALSSLQWGVCPS